MHRTGDARIEGMDSADDLQRLVRVGQLGADQAFLVGPPVSGGIARSGIPGARDHTLVVGDFTPFDADPVAKRSAGRFGETEPFGFPL